MADKVKQFGKVKLIDDGSKLSVDYNGTANTPAYTDKQQTFTAAQLFSASLSLTLGTKLIISDGSNSRMGVAVLSGANAVVNTTAVTSFSVIFLTVQYPGSNNMGHLTVQNLTPGTSFEIQSDNISDDSRVAWLIIDTK